MKKGDLITLYDQWSSYSILQKPNSKSDVVVDYIRRGEISLVMKVGVSSVKILSPRGVLGWIWIPRVKVVE